MTEAHYKFLIAMLLDTIADLQGKLAETVNDEPAPVA